MPLKIYLKPKEKMIVGSTVIQNGHTSSNLIIENRTPILREKDILNEKGANTPARRIYYTIQMMYIDPDDEKRYAETYNNLVRQFLKAVPSAHDKIRKINDKVISKDYYNALKKTRKLIKYETTICESLNSKKLPHHGDLVDSALATY